MQRVGAVVLLRIVRHAVDGVLAVADAVGVPAWDSVVHGVPGVLGCRLLVNCSVRFEDYGILTVVVDIVISENHVNVLPVLVFDKQVCHGSAVGDELQ
jgi:hypothetical protein